MDDFTAPKEFWKYYDLFRRKKLAIAEYSVLSGIPEDELSDLINELVFSQKRGEKSIEK